MRPFSDNIVFLDTEFTDLDPDRGELMSLALKKPSGEELYLELEYKREPSDWVKRNVLPYLEGKTLAKTDAAKRIRAFIGESKPYLIAFVNDFDVMHFYRLFTVEDQPCHWLPIDFASILWGVGIDPQKYSRNRKELARELGIDTEKHQAHNALDDVRLLKEVYDKFYEQFPL
jgi:hypothetical protein